MESYDRAILFGGGCNFIIKGICSALNRYYVLLRSAVFIRKFCNNGYFERIPY